VIAVLVAEGDQVEKGAAIVEAMKMEMVHSPIAGEIKRSK
jgi:biotin carboxyl carrier protein